MKNLYAKILKVMKDVEYLQKDDSVKAGSSSYRAITEEKVTSTVGKSMREHGLVIVPIKVTEHREDLEVIRGNGNTGLDRHATVVVDYLIADPDSGESMVIASTGTGIDTQDKAIGKAMTYCYKYLLLRTFCIPTGEDPDRTASDPDLAPRGTPPKQTTTTPPAAPPAPGVISRDQVKQLMDLCKTAEGAVDKARSAELVHICKMLGYAKATDIRTEHFEEIMTTMLDSSLPFDL